MKKEVSKPAMYGAIAAIVAVLVFVFMKFGSGSPPEFQKPKTSNIIPRYVWDSMPESTRKQMESQGYKPGDVDPSKSQPNSAPTGSR